MNGPAEPPVPKRRSRIGGAFKYRDFRLLWFGLLVGNLGTWMQFTTMGYFVAYLAGSPARAALYVGFLGASRAIPVLVCSPIAGVIADRYPRRRILLTTTSTTSLLSLALAILTATNHMNIVGLLLFSGAIAASQSFDAPARQSWLPFLVSREHFANAVGLNQIAFNTPAIVGPPIAGILIASVGISASFYVNAVAVLGVATAVFFMRPPPIIAPEGEPESMLKAIGAGIHYLSTHAVLRWVVLTLFLNAILLRPYAFLLPAYALHVVNVGPKELGWLMASAGAGGVSGAVLTALVPTHRRTRRWALAALTLAVMIFFLGLNHSYWIALAILFVLGIGNLSFTGSSNILIQVGVPDHMRGRTISVYSMIMQGMVPAGTLLLGSVAALTNLSVTLMGAGIVSLVLLAWTWLAHPALREGEE